MRQQTGRIAFQGAPGAYSHQACAEAFPGWRGCPATTFEGAIAAVREGRADLAMLPVENSTYGRVADIHHLLPESGLHIVGEHFVRVHINLLALPGARLEDVRTRDEPDACCSASAAAFLREHGIAPRVGADTAGSAESVAKAGDPDAGGARLRARRRDLRARGAGAAHRGPVEQHHALPRDGAGAAAGAGRGRR